MTRRTARSRRGSRMFNGSGHGRSPARLRDGHGGTAPRSTFGREGGLPGRSGVGVEVGRHAEEREQPGVEAEEVVPAGDAVAVEVHRLDRPRLPAAGRRPGGSRRSRAGRSRPPAATATPRNRRPARPETWPPRRGPAATGRTAASRTRRRHAAGPRSTRCRSARTRRRSSASRRCWPSSRRPGGAGVDVDGLERGPGPLQRAVHRRHRGVEQLGHLARLPAQHLAQDQHGALAGRAGAAAWRRTPAGCSRARRRSRPGPRRRRARGASGTGCSHVDSAQRRAEQACRRVDDGPRSIGRARRCGPWSMSRQTLVAMR